MKDKMENAQKVKVTFLGGLNQVGGNIVLFEDPVYDLRLMLDFGINIGDYNRTYQKDVRPSGIPDLIAAKLLPDPQKIKISNIYQGFPSESNPEFRNLDGILISHPHKDHFWGLNFINRSIPIYTGVVTRKIILAIADSEKKNQLNNYDGINWQTFRTNDVLQIKNLVIVPFHVDHSVPASYGFIIYSSAGPIVYTGDFRRHGPLAFMTEEFLDQVKTHNMYQSYLTSHPELTAVPLAQIKLLIAEGTRIGRGIVESEEFVEQNLDSIFKMNPFDFMLVKYERTDWDRFRTFSNFAKKYGWIFVLGERDAYFYYILNKDAIHKTMQDPNIVGDDHIWIIKWGEAEVGWKEEFRQVMYKAKKGQRLLESYDSLPLTTPKNGAAPLKYMYFVTHLHEGLKAQIEKQIGQARGVFISSSVDQYTEEQYDNTDKAIAILKDIGIPSYKVHASGHVNCHALLDFIDQIQPEILVPIHTSSPEMFPKMFPKSKIRVLTPKSYELIELN
jgi:ribonuclease J